MSETVTTSRTELSSIRRQLNELRQLLEENSMINDLVNRKKAMEITGWKSSTLTERIREGKVNVVSTNKSGTDFFSRKQLMGLK